MEIRIFATKIEMGIEAAISGASKINKALRIKGSANIILATGASQFEMLENLVRQGIDWSKVTCFHLDEYIGINESHPASFRKYLRERFYNLVKVHEFYFINGEKNIDEECVRLNKIIIDNPIDVAFIGIGENGHLAFNDPPADFEIEEPYIVVDLDKECRMQQLNEGWFPDLESVPKKAISMSIKQICKSKSIICTVPDERKADAVKNTITKDISPLFPSTILKAHNDTELFLDSGSALKVNLDQMNV